MSELRPMLILDHVARIAGVSVHDLTGKSRERVYTFPRHIAIYLIRTITGTSMTSIGAMFDRDHSTIVHIIQTVESEAAIYRKTRALLNTIRLSLPENL